MNLSMWIFSDWFGDEVESREISSGRMCIEGIRLYSEEADLNRRILYIGTSDSFFHDGRKNIILKNQNDIITLKSEDLISSVNKVNDAFFYFNYWYNKCTSLLKDGGTLQELLELSTEMFPTPVIIVDSAQTFVAISSPKASFQDSNLWKDSVSSGHVPDEMLKQFNLAHQDCYAYTGIFPVDPEFFFVKSYCKHIFNDSSRCASVILKVPGEDYSQGRLQIFDVFTNLVRDWIIAFGEEDSVFRIQSYFAKALSGEENGINGMNRQTSLFGWDNGCTKNLYVIETDKELRYLNSQIINEITNESGGVYAMIYDNRIVVLTNRDIVDQISFDTKIRSFLSIHSSRSAVSFSFSDMKSIGQAYNLAVDVLEHNPDTPGVLYSFQENSLRQAAKILAGHGFVTLLHPIVNVLKEYDEKNGSSLYQTLFSYLRNERSNVITSEELFVHRNTLIQRLRKITSIWNLDLDNPDERFYILLSLYLDHYFD